MSGLMSLSKGAAAAERHRWPGAEFATRCSSFGLECPGNRDKRIGDR